MRVVIIQVILFILCVPSNAQTGITNNGNLQIHTGASVTGFADLTNSSTAAFVNNGNLYLRNNVSNNQASMAAGTGTLYLTGSSVQAINGTQALKTYNLVTNNASGINLNNNLSVSGVHTYTAGMITTSSTPNYMIYESGSSYSGSGDTRHVNGWVKKIGSTNFNFPVGNATYERSIALTNLTASGEFDIRYNRAATPNYTSLFNPLVLVDTSEYWTINKISGNAAQVTMNWDNSKVPFPLVMLTGVRATYYDGVFWRSIGGTASGNVLTTGNITSGSVSAFNSDFTFGSVSYVLPLKIISFTAGKRDDYVKLNWVIGNELNVDNYELQRSDDGINFYTIATQPPFNRNGTEFYSYDDRKTLKGTVFYRLKINNLNGQVSYSDIVSVQANEGNKKFYVITNPVGENVDIYANASVKGIYNYTITTTGGQLMQSGILDIKNEGIFSIHLKQVFAPGAYILTVKNETNTLRKTIVKK